MRTFVVTLVGLLFVAVGAAAAPIIPNGATELGMNVLGCPGGAIYLSRLDFNGDADMDAMVIGRFLVDQRAKGDPAIVVFFGPGEDGEFLRAVLLPSGQTITDYAELVRRFPTPCQAVYRQEARA